MNGVEDETVNGHNLGNDQNENIHRLLQLLNNDSRNSLSSISQPDVSESKMHRKLEYIGEREYHNLKVFDNIELYFSEQVFSHNRPSTVPPYILKPDSISIRNSSSSHANEEKKLDSNPLYVTSMLPQYPTSKFIPQVHKNEKFITCFVIKSIDMSQPLLELLKESGTTDESIYDTVHGRGSSSVSLFTSNDHGSNRSSSPLHKSHIRLDSVDLHESVDPDELWDANDSSLRQNTLANSNKSNVISGKQTFSATPLPTDSKKTYPYSISAQLSDEVPIPEDDLIVAITDTCVYLVLVKSLSPTATFDDAPVPVLFRAHPLEDLR
jgi:hypothetical protein